MGKHFDKEYKLQTAKLIVEEGKKTREMADDLGVPTSTIRNWVQLYKDNKETGFVGSGNTPQHLKPQKELEERIKELEEENAILKKAMHVFTKKPK